MIEQVSILGTRVLRTEDPRFLTTGGIYTDDLRLPGACHVHFVRSTVAHARVSSVDVSAALAEPGGSPRSPARTWTWTRRPRPCRA
jgi:carbon-monoxide dehydrogenase large subunit